MQREVRAKNEQKCISRGRSSIGVESGRELQVWLFGIAGTGYSPGVYSCAGTSLGEEAHPQNRGKRKRGTGLWRDDRTSEPPSGGRAGVDEVLKLGCRMAQGSQGGLSRSVRPGPEARRSGQHVNCAALSSRVGDTWRSWVISEPLMGLPRGRASVRMFSGNSVAHKQGGGGEGFE